MSPDEIVWSGEALSLSSENSEGVFDILPGHANFMTLIKHTNVNLISEGSEEVSFSLEHGVLYFNEDEAKIYVHSSDVLGVEKGVKV